MYITEILSNLDRFIDTVFLPWYNIRKECQNFEEGENHMNLNEQFRMHSNFLFLAAVAAYIVGILLVVCPKKLLKSRGIVSPKRIKAARIIGITTILAIDIIIVVTWVMGLR